MKITETIQLYEFIGKLRILGFIGFTIAMFLVVFISNLAVLKGFELDDNRKFLYSMLSSLLIVVSTVVLKIDADSRLKTLNLANSLKSELINKNWKVIGFKRIEDNLGSNYNEKTIERIIETYPTEFVEINDLKDEKRGIKLVDNDAVNRIDSQLRSFAPYLKSQLVDHIKYNKLSTMGFDEIYELDPRFDKDLIETAITMYPKVLTPINLERNGKKLKGVKILKQ